MSTVVIKVMVTYEGIQQFFPPNIIILVISLILVVIVFTHQRYGNLLGHTNIFDFPSIIILVIYLFFVEIVPTYFS